MNPGRLAPGGEAALLHTQNRLDGMIPVLEGKPTLVAETDETVLEPGMCVGFPAGGDAHHLVNRTWQDVVILEIGDRPAGDSATYPGDDLRAVMGEEGMWQFTNKDGTPYLGSGAAD
ncbi:MAG: cupin domain-containing protein [Rhodobacteraceae bacterium]|nr:cupin domain-containing protein [Paracoccaceae bacterium]